MSAVAARVDADRPRRVVAAMSGGVDSSVAAALLLEQGFEVVGVTLHLAGGSSRCCSLADADDARRVADRLGIRFYVADYADRFREEVIDAFADAYLRGRTPIPCIPCNQRFKFHHLLERARALGASGVATGHYARVDADPATGRWRLRRAADAEKDQTYFLFNLTQDQLARAAFPLGELSKSAVRERARRLGLATADKPESQEICFVPDGDYAKRVEEMRPDALPGDGEIVDASGRVLGRHAGIHRFTVGQRRGLSLATSARLYVTHLDAARNRVEVGSKEALRARGAELEGVSWIAGAPPPAPVRARVRVRHRHEGADATVEPEARGCARVHFDAPVLAVSPGQAAVFEDGDQVLGGGWITGALR
ncbi:MAG: tRNA 2-thiouridine(34) synthase MnmA [Deltaproteobacteria bacterium]|nr:MAG: tRNA 2-thiouridine(34) synthase MnmA [Deltaproteobacteria bacterium]